MAGPLGWFDRIVGADPFGIGGSESAEPFVVSFGLLPALLGVVAAWMLYGQPRRGKSGVPQETTHIGRSGSPFSPFASPLLGAVSAIAGNRYYLHDVWYLGLTLPTRAMAQLCRFADWFLLDALFVEVPRRGLALSARAARPLRQGVVQLYALSVVLAAGWLLVVLSLLRG